MTEERTEEFPSSLISVLDGFIGNPFIDQVAVLRSERKVIDAAQANLRSGIGPYRGVLQSLAREYSIIEGSNMPQRVVDILEQEASAFWYGKFGKKIDSYPSY